MHVLGLWLPRDLAPLQDRLQYLRRKRSERNVRIVEKLQGLGVEIELDEVLHEARGESVGRPHIAAVLVRKGYVKDVSEAFKEYLGYYGRAYLPKEVLQPEEAVEVLSSLGATVCLAHPMLQKLPEGWLEAFIERLCPAGSRPSMPITANIPRPLPGAAWSWPAITAWASAAARTITVPTSPAFVWARATAPCACPTACWKSCARCAPGAACPARAWRPVRSLFGGGRETSHLRCRCP